MAELTWGRRFLMCPPEYFDVSYSINHWMDTEVKVDRDKAFEQWQDLAGTLRAAGAVVNEVPPQPDLPDFVFTANAGIIDNGGFLPAHMRFSQRRPEVDHVRRWMSANSWEVFEPPPAVQEGAGDALPFAGGLVAGYGMRSELSAYDAITERTGWTVHPFQLTDPRYYHIDIAFCPLDSRTALIVPEAFTPNDRRRLARLVPDAVLATTEEGSMFVANSIVVGRTVVMPACTPRLAKSLERRGFDIAVCDVSEFLKAGGGCRCLTLALDVTLSSDSDEVAA
ncbi:dimethylarginine dimethylaminohydrolase family protein [Kibdelosporangium persicum]|uniref:N-dimethylarginine dimethylaminohydrolase n=1 Tax=Kibdelosporangium persicum TaxID=2698649 RepID=A0ABX2EVD2_9PSEU|nr:arginine deiminase-related protein [Kibdelosporangium persicum]NRN62849.1 N-dimethylarginine dimethylaminohydrolase [Kibdelosporangium persicum]